MSSPVPDRPEPVRWRPSPARRLLRHPLVYWSLAAALALSSALIVSRASAGARAALADYGTTQRRLVVVSALEAGEPLADAVIWRDVPTALVPLSATTSLEAGATAAVPLVAGEVLVDSRVQGGGRGGLLGSDELGVALPRGPTVPVVTVLDRVAIVAAADPLAGTLGVNVDGVVVAVTDDQLTVAVPRDQTPAVAAAIAAGSATVALAP